MTPEPDAPGLIGRGRVWAELVAVLDGSRRRGAAVLITGDAGIGKTALAGCLVEAARERGHPVSFLTGRAETAGTPYAGLRALLGGRTAELDLSEMPAGQRAALDVALHDRGGAADPLALRSAVTSVLELLAGELSMVLVVDDVDRVDAASFDVLLTVASVLTYQQIPVLAVFAGRTDRVPVELADLLPAIAVGPLSDGEAGRVLDRVPGAPAGSARQDVLRRAGGNPLALRESPAGDHDGRLFAGRLRALPELSLRALTFAAAGESDVTVIAQADPAITVGAWQPAANAGLITISDTLVRFRHPLIESAVLDVAGPRAEREAHLVLARATTDPVRALWHRAHAAEGPDPSLAGELRAVAGAAADAVTAVGLLERAAELLPLDQRAPALIAAAEKAASVGRVGWANGIIVGAADAFAAAAQPELNIDATVIQSWAMTMRGRLAPASELLLRVMAADAPLVSRIMLVNSAGLPGFLRGDEDLDAGLAAAIRTGLPDDAVLLPRTVIGPDESVRARILAVGPGTTPGQLHLGTVTGAAAMLIDEPEQAIRLLIPAIRSLTQETAPVVYLSAPGAAGWALLDSGRWQEAEQLLVPLLSSPISAEATLIRAGTFAQLSIIALGRGRADAVAELQERARVSDITEVPAFRIRLRWAQGTAASARGAYEEAYHLLRDACAVDSGLRHDWQVLPLPDLVSAATRSGRTAEAAGVVTTFRRRYAGRWLSSRKQSRLAAAEALLIDDAEAAADALTAALPSGRFPYERAVLSVDLADRLRRAHRVTEARDVLIDASDAFDRLRATRWAARVNAELRTPQTRSDPFAGLSPQQEQIVRLAGAGLSNREIGERLYLSPRTIGSHLYRMFPQLGVANRTQLGELVTAADRSHGPDRLR